MRVVFWASLATIAYAYFGYALALFLYVKARPRPVRRAAYTPTVSIVMAARNEERNLRAKLANLQALDYPRELLQVVVASDGSTDGTAAILREYAPAVVPVVLEQSGGKAVALNAAVRQCTGELLVLLDARQRVDAGAVAALAACFADPEVGAVSGELLLEGVDGAVSSNALGIYWKIEKMVRKLEAASGSVIGVTGAIYAIRRELYVDIPPSTILDDVFVPMQVVRQGRRVVFEPRAIARDRIFEQKGKEFARKVRTLTGNYQLLRLAPWMLSARNPVLFRFVSHKLVRLLVPFLLIGMLIASFAVNTAFYRAAFWMQVLFYLLAAAGAAMPPVQRFKPVAIASTFVMLNAAAALALYHFVVGRKQVWA